MYKINSNVLSKLNWSEGDIVRIYSPFLSYIGYHRLYICVRTPETRKRLWEKASYYSCGRLLKSNLCFLKNCSRGILSSMTLWYLIQQF